MSQYCRFGWNCKSNTCDRGCIIIHERRCTSYGYNKTMSIDKIYNDININRELCIKDFNIIKSKMYYFQSRYNVINRRNRLKRSNDVIVDSRSNNK